MISIVLINCHLTGLSFLTTQRYKYVLLVIKKHKISNINIQDVLWTTVQFIFYMMGRFPQTLRTCSFHKCTMVTFCFFFFLKWQPFKRFYSLSFLFCLKWFHTWYSCVERNLRIIFSWNFSMYFPICKHIYHIAIYL